MEYEIRLAMYDEHQHLILHVVCLLSMIRQIMALSIQNVYEW